MISSRLILLRMRTVSAKSCRESQITHAMFLLWHNVEKYCRAGQATGDTTIWRMRIACWISKATNTHSDYVTLIVFPLPQLHERAWMLRYTYIDCIVTNSAPKCVSEFVHNLSTASPALTSFYSFIQSHQQSQLHYYTGCPRRNGQNLGRVFLMLNYTDITQNTYIQSWTVTEIMAIEKCGLLGFPRTVRRPWRHTHPLRMPGNDTPLANVAMQWPWRDYASAAACVKCLVTLRTTMTWVRVFL